MKNDNKTISDSITLEDLKLCDLVYDPSIILTKQEYFSVDVSNSDEVLIRVLKDGVKIRDITMGDLRDLVEYLNKKGEKK